MVRARAAAPGSRRGTERDKGRAVSPNRARGGQIMRRPGSGCERRAEQQQQRTCSRRHAGSSTSSRRKRMWPCDDHRAGRMSGEERPHAGGVGRSRLLLCVRAERLGRWYSTNASLRAAMLK